MHYRTWSISQAISQVRSEFCGPDFSSAADKNHSLLTMVLNIHHTYTFVGGVTWLHFTTRQQDNRDKPTDPMADVIFAPVIYSQRPPMCGYEKQVRRCRIIRPTSTTGVPTGMQGNHSILSYLVGAVLSGGVFLKHEVSRYSKNGLRPLLDSESYLLSTTSLC